MAAFLQTEHVLPDDASDEQAAAAIAFLLRGMIAGHSREYARDILRRFSEGG